MFGFIGSAIGAIGSCISSAVSSIGSICGSISGSIMGGISSLASGLIRHVPDITADKPIGIFDMIRQISGIFGVTKERPEELGMKVAQSRESPEDYESTQAYIDSFDKIQVDHEKLDNLSPVERLTYGGIGSALCVKAMEEKCGMVLPPDFWKDASKVVEAGKLSEEGVKYTMDAMKERGVKNAESFSNYMDGKANMEEQMVMYDSLKEALHREFPDLSEAELNIKTSHIKDFVADK